MNETKRSFSFDDENIDTSFYVPSSKKKKINDQLSPEGVENIYELADSIRMSFGNRLDNSGRGIIQSPTFKAIWVWKSWIHWCICMFFIDIWVNSIVLLTKHENYPFISIKSKFPSILITKHFQFFIKKFISIKLKIQKPPNQFAKPTQNEIITKAS